MSEKNHVPGFYFELSILGEEEVSVVAFKEVSGIQSEMEGGEMAAEENNAFKYRLLTQAKYTNLVLKRGLMPKNAPIAKWCEATLSDFKIASKSSVDNQHLSSFN